MVCFVLPLLAGTLGEELGCHIEDIGGVALDSPSGGVNVSFQVFCWVRGSG